MRRSVFPQYAIVKADTASLFTEKLNAELYRLKDHDPTVKFSESDPLTAYISFVMREAVPESISEEYESAGVRFVCEQCPCFSPTPKKDGTIDARNKHGDCAYEGNEFGRTFKDQAACDHLYELIRRGEVKLCFK